MLLSDYSCIKAMLKRCLLIALLNAACESIGLNKEGRPFQTSGPQTKKARRDGLPNCVLVRQTTADLVDAVDVAGNRW